MTDPAKGADDLRADPDLVRLYHTPELDLEGRALSTIYRRHSGAVLTALQDAGLSAASAQERIGAVFLQALNRGEGKKSLQDLLLEEARVVAADRNWRTADPADTAPADTSLHELGSQFASEREGVGFGSGRTWKGVGLTAAPVPGTTAPLTQVESRALQYIIAYLGENTFQPSFREIATHLGFKSTKQVSDLLISLECKGRIERVGQQSRSIRLLGLRLHVTLNAA